MLRARRRLTALVPFALLAACDSPPDADTIKQEIGSAVQDNLVSVKGQHEALDEKLVALDKKIDAQREQLDGITETLARMQEAAAAPPPTPPPPTPSVRPGRPDPSVTYKVPIDDAHTRGPDTALVTIVAFSDFQ